MANPKPGGEWDHSEEAAQVKVLIGLVLVGCGVGIVGIQTFGDPAGWAQAVPADLSKLGLAAIAVLALTVGGMVLTPGAAPAATPDAPPLPKPPTKRPKLDESEVAEVLSLDEDEEAARRRARRAARRKKKAREAAALESGEAPRKATKTRTKARTKAKHVRSYGDEDERPRTRKRSSKERTRKREREHATSGRH